jgi:hypothetical protein
MGTSKSLRQCGQKHGLSREGMIERILARLQARVRGWIYWQLAQISCKQCWNREAVFRIEKNSLQVGHITILSSSPHLSFRICF